MSNNIIAIILLILIWALNGKSILKGIQMKKPGEIYHHTAMGLFFTLLIIEQLLEMPGTQLQIYWIKIIGQLLYIPSIVLIFGSIIQLKKQGKAKSLSIGGTKKLVDNGLFSIVRHPMWTGFSLWSLALTLQFQSLLSLTIGIIIIILFRIASIKDDQEGIKYFGNSYRKYMQKTIF